MVNQRFVLLAIFGAAVFVAAVLQSAVSTAFLQMAWEDTRLLGGAANLSDATAVAGGAVAFVALVRNVDAVRFTDEVVGELKKVTWPSRDEAFQAATTVVFTAVFVSAVIAAYDFVWKNVADFFLFTKS
jgi:preprotein translocase SecE subunit